MKSTKLSIATTVTLAAAGFMAFAPAAEAGLGRQIPMSPAREAREAPEAVELTPIPHSEAKPITYQKVSFSCQMEGGQYVTKVQDVQVTYDSSQVPAYQEQALSEPTNAIIWTATLGSSNPQGLHTPQSRCQTVSAHLTNLASALGANSSAELPALMANISELGMVNGEVVVYPAYEGQAANDDNVIFTLKPSNANQSSDVLNQFRFGISPNIGGDVPANLRPPVVE